MKVLLLNLDNVSLRVGVYLDSKKTSCFKTSSDRFRSEDEYQDLLVSFLRSNSEDPSSFNGAILSSVVPSLTKRVEKACQGALGKKCLTVGKGIKSGIAVRTDNPSEVGSDLVCEALGALEKTGGDVLVVDCSSVMSFSVASKDKGFLGTAFVPGLRISADAMIRSAAQLMEAELDRPARYIGKNTRESMDSGIIGGFSSLIESFSKKIEDEYGKPLKKIITGSDGGILYPCLDPEEFFYGPDLVFDGLYAIFLKNAR